MAANNAIGTGAVVLTANADRLLAGLDKAEKATVKFAKTVPAKANAAGASGGGGGGILAGMLFGGVAGAAAGAAMAGVNFVLAKFDLIIGKIQNVGEAVKQYGNIDVARTLRIDRAAKAFDRISAASDDFFFRAAEKLAPIIERVASNIEALGAVGSAVFDELVDLVTGIVTEIVSWVDEVTGAGLATMSASDLAFAALRLVGKGFAYLVDSVKWFGAQTAFVFEAVTRSAADMSAALGFEDTAAKARGIADSLGAIGKAGADSFGESAVKVDAFFDRVQKRFQETDRIKKFTGLQLAGASLAGSNEAQSIIAKFQAGNIVTGQSAPDNPLKIQKDQLKEQREHKRLTQKLVERGERSIPLEIIP